MSPNFDENKVFFKTWGQIDERLDPAFYLNIMLLNKNIVLKSAHPISTFKQKVNMQRGRFGHRPRNDPRYYNGVYPFIQTGNVVKASTTNEKIEFTQTLNELGLSTSRLFDEKVVVITIAANIGYTAILDYPACFPDSLVALTSKDNSLTLEYLNVYVRFIREYIENLAPQAAQKNINLKQLSKLPIIIPDMDTQKLVISIMEKAYTEKTQKEKQAQALLDSINDYLLQELHIVMPPEEENTLKSRMFYVTSSKLIGNRFDPRKYTAKYHRLFLSIESSSFRKGSLRDIILSDVSGNWGLDEKETEDKLISCLTIRATEFDNKYNLNLENNRVKYRKYRPNIVEKIALNPEEILLEKSGGSDDQPVGRVAFIDEELLNGNIMTYSNFIHKIIIDETKAYPRYVFEYLRLMHNIKATEVMQTQTNGIRNLIMGEYFGQTILLPDIDTQILIANNASRMRKNAMQLEIDANDIQNKANALVGKILLGGEL